MQVQRIQNNNYNTNFGSKIKFEYQSIGGGYHPTSLNEVYTVLKDGMKKVDTTLLKAYKGLLNDGKNTTYTFFNSCLDRCSFLRVEDSIGKSYYGLPRYEEDLKLNAIRDMIVDIARKQGIIPGKPVGLKTLEGLYEYHAKYGNASELNKQLEKNGFKKHSPKTKLDLKEENQLVQDELKEIEKLKSSDLKYKDNYINRVKSIMDSKIKDKYRSEYEELIDTQKRTVKSGEDSTK